MNGRLALVIGGAGVIGAAIAERLKADGFEVSTADLSGADHTLDVSFEQQVGELFASIGELHCLVNAFGVTSMGAFQSISIAEWERVQTVNLRGVFLTCRAALEPMKTAGWGRIVNIGSVVAKNGGNPRPWIDPGESNNAANAAYAAAKAGVHALTLCLAKEAASHGITVNAVAPGPIAGPMTTKFPDALVRQIPAGRLGTPSEVAAAVSWLCSADAGFVTGEIVDVNGGLWVD